MSAKRDAGRPIFVGDTEFRFVAHPKYSEAHPGEACDDGEVCERCAIAERVDTGARYLLWLCGGINWSISRADPAFSERAS